MSRRRRDTRQVRHASVIKLRDSLVTDYRGDRRGPRLCRRKLRWPAPGFTSSRLIRDDMKTGGQSTGQCAATRTDHTKWRALCEKPHGALTFHDNESSFGRDVGAVSGTRAPQTPVKLAPARLSGVSGDVGWQGDVSERPLVRVVILPEPTGRDWVRIETSRRGAPRRESRWYRPRRRVRATTARWRAEAHELFMSSAPGD